MNEPTDLEKLATIAIVLGYSIRERWGYHKQFYDLLIDKELPDNEIVVETFGDLRNVANWLRIALNEWHKQNERILFDIAQESVHMEALRDNENMP